MHFFFLPSAATQRAVGGWCCCLSSIKIIFRGCSVQQYQKIFCLFFLPWAVVKRDANPSEDGDHHERQERPEVAH